MKEFKPGERVVVYEAGKFPRKGEVVGAEHNALRVIIDGNENMYDIFHPKQVRRLVKKERRRVWVEFNGVKNPVDVSLCEFEPGFKREVVEFIEVKKK